MNISKPSQWCTIWILLKWRLRGDKWILGKHLATKCSYGDADLESPKQTVAQANAGPGWRGKSDELYEAMENDAPLMISSLPIGYTIMPCILCFCSCTACSPGQWKFFDLIHHKLEYVFYTPDTAIRLLLPRQYSVRTALLTNSLWRLAICIWYRSVGSPAEALDPQKLTLDAHGFSLNSAGTRNAFVDLRGRGCRVPFFCRLETIDRKSVV